MAHQVEDTGLREESLLQDDPRQLVMLLYVRSSEIRCKLSLILPVAKSSNKLCRMSPKRASARHYILHTTTCALSSADERTASFLQVHVGVLTPKTAQRASVAWQGCDCCSMTWRTTAQAGRHGSRITRRCPARSVRKRTDRSESSRDKRFEGTDTKSPGLRRGPRGSELEPGYCVSPSGEKGVRILHKRGVRFKVPGIDCVRYAYVAGYNARVELLEQALHQEESDAAMRELQRHRDVFTDL